MVCEFVAVGVTCFNWLMCELWVFMSAGMVGSEIGVVEVLNRFSVWMWMGIA